MSVYDDLESIAVKERKAWSLLPDCECSNPSVTWIALSKTYGCNGCGNLFDSKGNKTGNIRRP